MSEHTTNLIKTLAGRFFKMDSAQKTLKPVVLWCFRNVSRNTLCLCYEIENFTENTFLSKNAKLTFVNSFVINEFFESHNVTAESFFTGLSLFIAWFISVYKIECFLVNICIKY